MILYRQYLHTTVENQKIKLYISFNKETTSWATGQPKKVGYQVTCVPCKITFNDNHRIEESGAFTGFNDCILEVDRQSKKRLSTAIELLQEKIPTYKEWFIKNQGISFIENS